MQLVYGDGSYCCLGHNRGNLPRAITGEIYLFPPLTAITIPAIPTITTMWLGKTAEAEQDEDKNARR